MAYNVQVEAGGTGFVRKLLVYLPCLLSYKVACSPPTRLTFWRRIFFSNFSTPCI